MLFGDSVDPVAWSASLQGIFRLFDGGTEARVDGVDYSPRNLNGNAVPDRDYPRQSDVEATHSLGLGD